MSHMIYGNPAGPEQHTWWFSAIIPLGSMALGKSLSFPKSQFAQIVNEQVRLDGFPGQFSALKCCPIGKAAESLLIRVLEGLNSRLLS